MQPTYYEADILREAKVPIQRSPTDSKHKYTRHTDRLLSADTVTCSESVHIWWRYVYSCPAQPPPAHAMQFLRPQSRARVRVSQASGAAQFTAHDKHRHSGGGSRAAMLSVVAYAVCSSSTAGIIIM